MKRIAMPVFGLLLASLSIVGVVHGVRAALAQALYGRAKYGDWKEQPERILEACERADALYPWNYYFCAWAAERAFYADDRGDTRVDRRAAAARWCERGLALNPYAMELRLLDARLAEARSPAEAARKWAGYVDWHFWEPYNHAILVELYARAGQYENAMQSMRWVAGSRYEREARAALRSAWQRERSSTAAQGPATGAAGE